MADGGRAGTDTIEQVATGALAASSVTRWFATASPTEQTAMLNGLARRAAESAPCLDALLRLIDDHHLDRPAIRRVLVDNDEADDAHQDVLIAVAQSIARFRGDAAFRTWLHSVARNVAVNRLRRRRETTTIDDATAIESGAARLSSLIASRSDLVEAVRCLPEPYREAVVLRDIEQRTYREIAAATDAEINTVKSRISRGRALVAAMMSERLVDVEVDG